LDRTSTVKVYAAATSDTLRQRAHCHKTTEEDVSSLDAEMEMRESSDKCDRIIGDIAVITTVITIVWLEQKSITTVECLSY